MGQTWVLTYNQYWIIRKIPSSCHTQGPQMFGQDTKVYFTTIRGRFLTAGVRENFFTSTQLAWSILRDRGVIATQIKPAVKIYFLQLVWFEAAGLDLLKEVVNIFSLWSFLSSYPYKKQTEIISSHFFPVKFASISVQTQNPCGQDASLIKNNKKWNQGIFFLNQLSICSLTRDKTTLMCSYV